MTISDDGNRTNSFANFSAFPLLWLALAFGIGILLAQTVKLHGLFWLATTSIAVAATVYYLRRTGFQTATTVVLLAFLTAGALLQTVTQTNVAPERIAYIYDAGQINFKTALELVGTLENEPEETPNGYFLNLQTEQLKIDNRQQPASGAVRLFLPVKNASEQADFESLNLHYKAQVLVKTAITREDRFRNLGGSDFKQFLAAKNLDATGIVKTVDSIQKLKDPPTFAPLGWLYKWRARLIHKFRTNFSIQTAGVLAASLLNNRYFLDKKTSERFRIGGTFHVLVISGAHITFIGLLFAGLTRIFTRKLWLQFSVANVLLWLFAIAVGAETPVTRAAIMFTIFHAAALFGRRSSALNALGAASLLLLVWKPANLFDTSFQLTLVAVLAIVGMWFPIWEKMQNIGAWQPTAETPVPPDCKRWLKNLSESIFWSERGWQRQQNRQVWSAMLFKSGFAKRLEKSGLQVFWRYLFGSILVSIVASAWLLPLATIHFHRFSPAAIFLNVWVGALIAVETFSGLFAVSVAAINQTLAQPFIAWTETLNFLLVHSSEPFIFTNTASLRLPVYNGAASVLYWIYYLPLIALTIIVHRWNPFQLTINSQQSARNRIVRISLLTAHCLLLAVLFFHPFSAAIADGRLHIDFLDVGQGDAALITTPNGTKILIDAGGRPNFSHPSKNETGETTTFEPDARSIGDAVVSDFLWQKGLDKVDFLVATHAHADHMDGLNDVANNFSVQTAFVGRTPPMNAEFARFAETLNAHSIQIQKVERGDVLEIDNVKIEVLAPVHNDDPNAASDNDDSIALRIVYGSRKFLFTGDIEANSERMLLAQPESLTCDVVKVAHHGSRTSSTENFVRATNAKFAVIPVGRESPYGHPRPEVIARWRGIGAKPLTTGENGTISFCKSPQRSLNGT